MPIALVSESLPTQIKEALRQKIDVLEIPKSILGDSPISGHPDILIGKIGNTIFVNSKEQQLINTLSKNNIPFVESEHDYSSIYPGDCALNFFQIDNYLFCKSNILAPAAYEYAKNKNLTIVDLKQGYAKCSTIVMNNKIITADKNIAANVSKLGYEVCHILPGGIKLDPYDYGFVGGASCYFDNNLIFFGNPTNLSSWSLIKTFCDKNNITIKTFDLPLTDFGGAIILGD